MDVQQQEILGTVSGFLIEIIGDDAEVLEPIGPTTNFTEDLELESIMFVALAEQLQDRYGEDLDFIEWLSNKQKDEIMQLEVGDLVEFIAQCRA